MCDDCHINCPPKRSPYVYAQRRWCAGLNARGVCARFAGCRAAWIVFFGATCVWLWLTIAPVRAIDLLTIRREGRSQRLEGKVLVEAQDGGLLLLAPDGRLWAFQPDEVLERQRDDRPFQAATAREVAERLSKEMGPAFRTYATAHYVICYNTSEAYAQWCGALFERLYRAFTNDWRNKGFDIHPPEFPLVAIVFSDRASYARHARAELGDAVHRVIGYYNLQTNRITTYDLTSSHGSVGRSSVAAIGRRLSRPDAERTVATVVHEATHQIAYNCGLQTRLADIPLWVSEGIAVYYETPDLKSRRGWKGIGEVNRVRLNRFRSYARRRPPNSLKTLIQDDTRFRDPRLAEDAYAEAWALNYFLLRKHQPKYVEYLRLLSAKGPLVRDDPQTRLNEFQQVFGEDWSNLDRQFLRYMQRVR